MKIVYNLKIKMIFGELKILTFESEDACYTYASYLLKSKNRSNILGLEIEKENRKDGD